MHQLGRYPCPPVFLPVTPGAVVGDVDVVTACLRLKGRGPVSSDPVSMRALPPLEGPRQAAAVDMVPCSSVRPVRYGWECRQLQARQPHSETSSNKTQALER